MKMQDSGGPIKEFRSHSSWLYNDRLAVLFYLLDMDGVKLNEVPINSEQVPGLIRRVKSLNFQIYKNVRMVIRSDPVMRKALHLDTKDSGIYTTDMQANTIAEAIRQCDDDDKGYTPRRCRAIINELNDFEMTIKSILQYYSYFVRVATKQKPDLMLATQRYSQMADKMTIEQLKSVVGKNHKINFDAPQLEDAEDFDDDESFEEEEDDDE